MILIWHGKVYRIDEDTVWCWSGTTEQLRAFRDATGLAMEKHEAKLPKGLPEALLVRMIPNDVIQTYMRSIDAVLDDLQKTMGKRDFDKCFRIKTTPEEARSYIHEDGQGGYDLDQRLELKCPECFG